MVRAVAPKQQVRDGNGAFTGGGSSRASSGISESSVTPGRFMRKLDCPKACLIHVSALLNCSRAFFRRELKKGVLMPHYFQSTSEVPQPCLKAIEIKSVTFNAIESNSVMPDKTRHPLKCRAAPSTKNIRQ